MDEEFDFFDFKYILNYEKKLKYKDFMNNNEIFLKWKEQFDKEIEN